MSLRLLLERRDLEREFSMRACSAMGPLVPPRATAPGVNLHAIELESAAVGAASTRPKPRPRITPCLAFETAAPRPCH
jgi:hypothetical protein